MKLLLTLGFLFLPALTWAAPPTHVLTSQSGGLSASSCSGSHNTSAGSDRLAIARVVILSSSAPTITATYDSVSMTQQILRQSAQDTQQFAAIFRLAAPNVGNLTYQINFGVTVETYACYFSTYTGAHQTDFTADTSTNENLGASPVTVDVTSGSDEVVADIAGFGSAPGHTTGVTLLAVGTGQTQRGTSFDASNDSLNAAISDETGSASTTMSWTFGAEQGSQYWLTVAAAFRGAGAATPTTRRREVIFLP